MMAEFAFEAPENGQAMQTILDKAAGEDIQAVQRETLFEMQTEVQCGDESTVVKKTRSLRAQFSEESHASTSTAATASRTSWGDEPIVVCSGDSDTDHDDEEPEDLVLAAFLDALADLFSSGRWTPESIKPQMAAFAQARVALGFERAEAVETAMNVVIDMSKGLKAADVPILEK